MAPSPSLVTKIKVQLKLAVARLRMVQKRDEALSKTHRRAMAQLLETGKTDSARIRVENIIRSDITTELHELLELYCELLLARAGLLDSSTCDPGLEEAVQSIIYAAPKTEIKELQAVRALLGEKYGKAFVLVAVENSAGKVNEQVVRKLGVSPPREELVNGYLEEIAKAYGVDWPKGLVAREDLGEAPPDYVDDDAGNDAGGSGGNISKGKAQRTEDLKEAEARKELSRATPPRDFGPSSPLHVNPPTASTDNMHPKITLNKIELTPSKKMQDAAAASKPAAKAQKEDISDGVPDVNELAKRFAALKR